MQQHQRLLSRQCADALHLLGIEHGNIRQMWDWFVVRLEREGEEEDFSDMLDVIEPLGWFYEFNGLQAEGAMHFRRAEERLSTRRQTTLVAGCSQDSTRGRGGLLFHTEGWMKLQTHLKKWQFTAGNLTMTGLFLWHRRAWDV